MNTLLVELTSILNQEIELHKELLSLLQKDRELLINLSVDEIFENGKKKETLILKIKMLEESRLLVIDNLSQRLALPSHELTLSKIASLVEEPFRSSLASLLSTFISLIRSIREINQCNDLIVKDSLYYFDRSLSYLNCSSLVSPTYVDGGKIKDLSRWGSIVSKEI